MSTSNTPGGRSTFDSVKLGANRPGLMAAFFLLGPIFPALKAFFACQRPA